MSDETLDTLRRGYAAVSQGDMSAVAGLATADVQWGATGAFPGIEGLYRGAEVIQHWADAIRSDWEDFEVSLDEVLHGDDEVVVAERLRGRERRSGDGIEVRIFAAYWFEDGNVRRRAARTSRQTVLESAGLRE